MTWTILFVCYPSFLVLSNQLLFRCVYLYKWLVCFYCFVFMYFFQFSFLLLHNWFFNWYNMERSFSGLSVWHCYMLLYLNGYMFSDDLVIILLTILLIIWSMSLTWEFFLSSVPIIPMNKGLFYGLSCIFIFSVLSSFFIFFAYFV